MVPIISEVYNRSINLLTERKGSGELRVTTRGGCALAFHQHTTRCLVLTHLLTAGYNTTVDKCILLAYHLYAWSFVLSLALSISPSLALFRRNSLRRFTYGRLTIDSGKSNGTRLVDDRFLRLLTIRQSSIVVNSTFEERND